jgi:hypothetical protein
VHPVLCNISGIVGGSVSTITESFIRVLSEEMGKIMDTKEISVLVLIGFNWHRERLAGV